MKKYIPILLLGALLATSCTEKTETSKAGKRVGEIYVTALPGAKTVLVNLDGLWRVRSGADWMSFDVNGREGAGAFTVYYGSNESDFVTSNPTRRGAIIIESLKSMKADTLWLRQQGVPDGKEYSSAPQDSYVEFIDTKLTSVTVRYANFGDAGAEAAGAVFEWMKSTGILCARAKMSLLQAVLELDTEHVIDGSVLTLEDGGGLMIGGFGIHPSLIGQNHTPDNLSVSVDEVNVMIADFISDTLGTATLSNYAKSILASGYDTPGAGAKWLIGGSFYYYSAMETGYPDTPSWYPANPSDNVFLPDRQMQAANLVDCVWMAHRGFNPTYTDGSRSWRADYVYASTSLWNAATMVRVLDAPLPGMKHKPIEITIKY